MLPEPADVFVGDQGQKQAKGADLEKLICGIRLVKQMGKQEKLKKSEKLDQKASGLLHELVLSEFSFKFGFLFYSHFSRFA